MQKRLAILVFSTFAAFAQTPVVNGIANNYSGLNGGSVAQGAIFIVVGSSLSVETTTLQSVPLQTTLFGVRMEITINGTTVFAPMYYALPTQLAGILPSSTPIGTGTLIVRSNGRSSNPVPITVVRSAFGVLTSVGGGAARVQDASQGSQELSPSLATKPGNVLVFYGSGLGPVTGDETIAQTQTDLTSIPISVTIGGRAATVYYRGRTIFPGLDQINVLVPTLDTTGYGCSVAVSITTDGVPANTTTIPVAATGTTCSNPSGGGSGASSDTNPTPAEIDTWSARQSYTGGTITLNRTISYSAGSVTKADTGGTVFNRVVGSDIGKLLRGEIPPGFPVLTPAAGSCVVWDGSNLQNPYPNLTYSNMDAGPDFTVNGPNGLRTMVKRTHQIGGPTYDAGSTMGSTYQSPGTYFFAGAGGPEVGAFSGSINVANDFVLTNPLDFATSINRSAPLIVRWTGGDPDTYLTIQAITYAGSSIKAFTCIEKTSAAQFQVPSNVVSQMLASPTGSFSVTARGAGARFNTPAGLDILTAFNAWSWQFLSQWQ